MVEGPISKSFILSNSLRVADPDLLDLGVGLCRPETASRMPVPRGLAAFSLPFGNVRCSLKHFHIRHRKKVKSNSSYRNSRNFLRTATIPRQRDVNYGIFFAPRPIVNACRTSSRRSAMPSGVLRQNSRRMPQTAISFSRTWNPSHAWAGVYQSSRSRATPIGLKSRWTRPKLNAGPPSE